MTSPTLIDQFNRMKAELPNAKGSVQPINTDNAIAGARMAFGSPVQTIYKYDKAERILTLDADIFSGFNVAYIKDFAKGRKFSEEKKGQSPLLGRDDRSLTGAKADHRLAIKPSQLPEVAKAIARLSALAVRILLTQRRRVDRRSC